MLTPTNVINIPEEFHPPGVANKPKGKCMEAAAVVDIITVLAGWIALNSIARTHLGRELHLYPNTFA